MKKETRIRKGNGWDWKFILKIAIAVLIAILATIAGVKSEAVAAYINGII